MKILIQAFVILMALSFAMTPVMAKESSDSGKAETSQAKKVKKAKKAKKIKKDKKTAKSKKAEKPVSAKKSKTKAKADPKPKSAKKEAQTTKGSEKQVEKNKSADSKSSSASGSSKPSAESDSNSSSSSKKKTKKKAAKSALTGTDKAKQFKNITVDINRADAATMAHYLVGIGATRAEAIVKYRKKNGKFKSTENLMKVPGIGEAIYAGLKKNVSPSKGETSVPKKTTTSSKKK